MKNVIILIIVILNVTHLLLSSNTNYNKYEVYRILSDYTRLLKISNTMWRMAQKDSMYLSRYKEICKLDSLNIIDNKFEMYKIYDKASEYIIHKNDTTMIKILFDLLNESYSLANEHLSHVTGNIILNRPEMIAEYLKKQEKRRQKNIYQELEKGLEYIKYEKPNIEKYQKAKKILINVMPKNNNE